MSGSSSGPVCATRDPAVQALVGVGEHDVGMAQQEHYGAAATADSKV